MLTVAGLHVPVMPLVELAGKTGAAEPEHIGAIASKVGTMTGLTVTFNVAPVAHWSASGVNV